MKRGINRISGYLSGCCAFLKSAFQLLSVIGLIFLTPVALQAQMVTPATGGTNLSADNAEAGNVVWTTLSGPVITETAPGQLSAGSIRFRLPSGFIFDTGGTQPTVTVTQPKAQQIFITLDTVKTNEIIFNLTGSSGGSPPNNPHTFSFSNFRLRPSAGSPLASGNITNAGSSAPGGTQSYGSLSMVPGADAKVRVESAPNSSGVSVATQSLTAGESLTVYSNVRDQFDNFKRNQSATWSLISPTGGVTAGDLSTSGASATFNANLVGTGIIKADYNSLTATTSGTITVNPATASTLLINTQPSATGTAGQTFSTQPVIELRDDYGNLATDNNFTQVSTSINSGSGSLQGTTTATASGGIATFTNLSYNIAETINLTFSSTGFTSLTSNNIAISPNVADHLDFVVQPSNGNRNDPISPPIEVQIYDAYDNEVPLSGKNIILNLFSGGGNITVDSVATDAGGKSTFSSVSFNQTGTKTLKANAFGITASPESNSFTISNAGSLAGFVVEVPGGGNIGTQTAGTAFNLRLAAVDGIGDTLDGAQGRDNFTGFVDLTTTSAFSGSTTTTSVGPFVNGIYEPHSVTLTQTGSAVNITATNSSGTESGFSNNFQVIPGAADETTSTISLSDTELVADGSSTSTVTVQIKDAFGNLITSGGDAVSISINSGTGTISGTTDNGNGTYTATITAPNDVGSATIGATVNGSAITSGNPTITYTYGSLSTFVIEASGGGNISTQTAGTSFNIQITAQDAYNNTVTSFSGAGNTVEITSSQTLSSGSGTTATFTNGVLSSHSVTITSAGTATITARKTASTETGTSNSFTIAPAGASTANSTISTSQSFLQVNGVSNATITVQLIDAYGNNLVTGGAALLITHSGVGSISGTTDQGNGSYTATLSPGASTGTATLGATLGGVSLSATETVTVTQFNVWDGSGGGSPATRSDWGTASNWSLGTVPSTNQVVLIQSGWTYYPIIDSEDPVLDFLSIETGATVTLTGRTLTINDEISGGGSISGNNATVNIYGDSKIQNFIAGSSTINLNGSSTQVIENDFTANVLNIQNNVTASNYLEAFTDINIGSGNTLTMNSGSQLVAIGDITITGTLVGNSSAFTFGGNITGSNISLSNTSLTLNGTTQQQLNGITTVSGFTLDNPAGAVINNDLQVTGTLSILDGILTIESGHSFVSNNKSGNTGNFRMKRNISGSKGWRLLSAPISSTFGDLLDGTITQGYPGAYYSTGSNPGDTVQPNVFYYLESYPGTDNQRYVAPSSASATVTAGRGLFVYFFGNIATDSRYSNPLPDTLDIQGVEHDGDGTTFTFPVTYTASADTGWNLVGNPFAATIDWDDGNWTKTNMDNTLYVWNSSASQYLYWNGITGSLGDGTIRPFQGFWVKANGNGSPSLKVNKASKTVGGAFYKSRADTVNLKLTLKADTLVETAYISFTPEGSYGKDIYDAYRLLPLDTDTYLEVFTLLENGIQLAINNVPRDFGIPIEIPLYLGGYQSGKAISGSLELNWEGMETLPEGWTVTLIDQAESRNKGRSRIIDMASTDRLIFTKTADSTDTVTKIQPGLSPKMEQSKAKLEKARYILRIDPGIDAADLPHSYRLYQNYPNPFNPTTKIGFDLPLAEEVRLEIFDILGRKIQTLADGELKAGRHTYNFNMGELSSGVYLYRLTTREKVFTRKMMLIK